MVIQNRLGIRDEAELACMEEMLSRKRAASLCLDGWLKDKKAGACETLQVIHRMLFQDVYDFAGKIRDVDLAKENFRFAPVMFLDSSLSDIEKMPQITFNEIVEKYVEMNIAHPFREGNGRSGRIWLDHILRNQLQMVVDWSEVGKEDYLDAMRISPVRDTWIKAVLKEALTDRYPDPEVILKGIDQSWAFEGLDTYRTEDLIEKSF